VSLVATEFVWEQDVCVFIYVSIMLHACVYVCVWCGEVADTRGFLYYKQTIETRVVRPAAVMVCLLEIRPVAQGWLWHA